MTGEGSFQISWLCDLCPDGSATDRAASSHGCEAADLGFLKMSHWNSLETSPPAKFQFLKVFKTHEALNVFLTFNNSQIDGKLYQSFEINVSATSQLNLKATFYNLSSLNLFTPSTLGRL